MREVFSYSMTIIDVTLKIMYRIIHLKWLPLA